MAIAHSVEALLNIGSDSFLDCSLIRPLVDMYGAQLCIDRSLLEAELTVASSMWKNHRQTSDRDNKYLPTITTFQQLLTKVAFPNLLKCIQVALTLPITSATCERSFSAMKLLKSFLRNRMSDERLSNMATLFISKDRVQKLDRNELINLFADKPTRRLLLN